VNTSKYPLRINVGFLIHQPVGSYRDVHFDLPKLDLDEEFHLVDFTGVTRFGRAQQGIVVQANFQATIQLECVRCLTEYTQSIMTEFSELYAFKFKGVSESGLVLPDDGNINLAPLVREYLWLEVPISSLCQEDCKGLCTVCGTNLNTETCEHMAQIYPG
jgi:uncharacterized protein